MIAAIADDFTGATDVAVAFRQAGLRTAIRFGPPDGTTAAPACDALVVALKTRTVPGGEAVAASLRALDWLRNAGATRLYFKYCSTFDSTPAGNIGPVLDALSAALGAAQVVTTPAAPEHGRTQYQGYLFVEDRLLAESHMRHHPLNPMTDSHLPRVLGAQTRRRVGVLSLATVRSGAHAIRHHLAGAGEGYLLADAIDESDLRSIGRAVLDHPLVAGASGLARGLAGAIAAVPGFVARPDPPLAPQPAGGTRAVALAGSCSARTLEQVRAFRESDAPAYRIDALAARDPLELAGDALRWYDANTQAAPVLLYSSATPAELARVQGALGVTGSAELIEAALRLIAVGLVARGVTRIVVAGGETAGAVVTALDIDGGLIGPEAAPGVPWILADRLELLLKSGNFGGPRLLLDATAAGPGTMGPGRMSPGSGTAGPGSGTAGPGSADPGATREEVRHG